MKSPDVVNALAALAHDSRLAAFRLLVQAGPDGLAASKISESLHIASSLLSFHLKELVHAGLVTSRQDGRFVIYTAHYDTMNDLLGFLTENCCNGKSCSVTAESALDRIGRTAA